MKQPTSITIFNRNITRSLATIALLVAALSLVHLPSLAEEGPAIVRVADGSVEIPLGGTAEVAVEIDDVQALYAFDVQLSFNPTVVQVIDADPQQDGVQVSMGLFMDSGYVIRNVADNNAGTIRYIMTQLNPSEAKSGSGVLIVVKFKGQQASSASSLLLEKGNLATRSGNEIPSNLESGTVKVVNSVSGPTNTPVPTQGGGTPLPTGTPVVMAPMGTTATPTTISTDSDDSHDSVRPSPTPSLTPIPTQTATQEISPTPANQDAIPSSPTAEPTHSLPSPTHQPTNTPLPTATSRAAMVGAAASPTVMTNAPTAIAVADAAELSADSSENRTTSSEALKPADEKVQAEKEGMAPSPSFGVMIAIVGVLGILIGFGVAMLVGRRR